MALIPGQYRYIVSADEAGQRLDVFLSRRIEALSRSAVSRLIREGRVRTGRVLPKTGLVLLAGAEVVLDYPEPEPSQAQPEELPLTILYQDDDLAVIDKPAGMVTHPAAGHASGTLVNALLHHLRNLSGIGGELRPGIVHRLDKDTSGLLLVAKSDRGHQALTLGIQTRQIKRRYLVMVWGQPTQEAFTLETKLGRSPRDRKQFAVSTGSGKMAITHFKVLRKFRNFSLLQAQLETGRTHQIRVHCQYLGLPVVGDRDYGLRAEAVRLQRMKLPRPDRQLLHSAHLELQHPFTGELLQVEAPLPEDFKNFQALLGD